MTEDLKPIIPPGEFCDAFIYSRSRGRAFNGIEEDDEDPLWLLFTWEYELLMNGQKLEHRDGTIVHKGRDKIDTKMALNGYMAYGIRESWLSE